jgi:hypothetical protein
MTGGGDPDGDAGSTGGSSDPFSDPPVNQNTVLGSWDTGFLQGTGGSWNNPGWTPDQGIQNLIGDLTNLIRDLTNILSALSGSWTPDGNDGYGVGAPGDWRGQGSVGGLDDGTGHHDHHNLWKPNN